MKLAIGREKCRVALVDLKCQSVGELISEIEFHCEDIWLSFQAICVPSQSPIRCDHCPHDPVEAMWKAQMLNGMRPTQFSGNPVDFPSFREQICPHLEGDLLTDAQRVEYLPKFVIEEALEVG